ncbi:PRC-barrel domain containing protein [Halomonas sp. ZH2S]|uniref:PRC-barrel domain containing protein n=2 Tax=Vreelandella zhuhanensis TaxID=2684210 RepID=A0A7X3H205_9GAMM|nr:PRC-barrel domain containing protein [Halomonas zhuhanensis]
MTVQTHAAEDEKQPNDRADRSDSGEPQNNKRVRSLDEWSYKSIYEQGGFRAENFLDAQVFSPQENEIGEMVNIILDWENQIVTVIAEVGGVWDSGDRHVAIPWDEVEFFEDGIKVPVRHDNLEEYDLFSSVNIDESYIYKQEMERISNVEENVATGPQTWKITDIMHDYASMENDGGYGYITDALFSRSGVMQAIIVKPASAEFGQGPRAYPFYGYPEGWRPGDTHYILTYSRKDVEELPVFEYEKYGSVFD